MRFIASILLMLSAVAWLVPLASAGEQTLEVGQAMIEGFDTDPIGGFMSQSGNPHAFSHPDVLWRVHNSPYYLWDATTGHAEKGSIRLGSVEGHAILYLYKLAVQPDTFVEATVWAKTENASGETYISLEFLKGNEGVAEHTGGSPYGNIVYRLEKIGGTRDWSLLVARGRVPAGADGAQVSLITLNNTTGHAWFDDLKVRSLPPEEWKGDLLGQPRAIDAGALTPDDYVQVKNTHLSYRGQRLRIWSAYGATNLMPVTYSDIDAEVRRFRDHGFNAIRSLWWDMEVDDTYTAGDGSTQDRRDYLIDSLGRHGVFMWNDLLNSCQIRPDKVNAIDDPATADEWAAAMRQVVGDEPGAHTEVREFIPVATDPRCEAIYHEYIKKVLAHKNKWNGLTYAEDPTIFNWELMNEDWWIMRVLWGNHLSLPEMFQKQLYEKWNQWLSKKYGSTAKLRAAWGGLLEGEALEKQSVLLLPLAGEADADKIASALGLNVKFSRPKYGPSDFSRRRGGDVVHFLLDTNIASKQRAEKVFRAQGRPGIGSQIVPLIYDTGYSGDVIPFYMHSFSSATAAATYLDMSTHNPRHPTFPFSSGLREPPGINNWIDNRRFVGKPAYIYEIMTFNPQKYRAEFPYRLLALLAIQDFDVVSFHAYSHPVAYLGIEDAHTAHALEYMANNNNWNGTTMRTDEVMMSVVRVAGEIFKRGYLKPAPNPTVVTMGADEMWSIDGMDGNTDSSGRTVFHRGFRWAFDPSREKNTVRGKLISAEEHAMTPVVRPTDQIAYRWQEGIMTIDDSRAKVLVGFVPETFEFDGGLSVSDISVHTPPDMQFVIKDERYVALGVTSADGKPLASSSRVLVSAVSTSHNSGLDIDLNHMKKDTDYSWGLARSIRNGGGLPVLVARVGLTLRAPWLAGRTARMTDFNGKLLAEQTLAAGELTIPSDLPVYLTEIVDSR